MSETPARRIRKSRTGAKLEPLPHQVTPACLSSKDTSFSDASLCYSDANPVKPEARGGLQRGECRVRACVTMSWVNQVKVNERQNIRVKSELQSQSCSWVEGNERLLSRIAEVGTGCSAETLRGNNRRKDYTARPITGGDVEKGFVAAKGSAKGEGSRRSVASVNGDFSRWSRGVVNGLFLRRGGTMRFIAGASVCDDLRA